jgi:hypothetical protein
MKNLIVLLVLFFILNHVSFAQIDSNQSVSTPLSHLSPLSFSSYIEVYYTYDFGNPSHHKRPDFLYSHNRHNEVNINLAYIKSTYQTESVRANLALMTGTYSNANLAKETGVLKNIYEANVGVKLSRTKNLWLDAGVFSSHIGFESAIGKDCWNLTRSILADNSPYFESGVKLGYKSANDKWFFSLLYLNGWQRIQRPDNYNTPAFGHQLTYTPKSTITLNSSSFAGSDTPDSSNCMRYFHNLYGIFQIHPRLGITAGFDIGAQQAVKYGNTYHLWYSPVLIAKVKLMDKLSLAFRGEYYYDESGIIISTGTPNGFQTFGYSINIDYAIQKNIVWRLEGRTFNSKDKIFLLNDKASNTNYSASTSLALSF